MSISPFIKWLGGKKQLVPQIIQMAPTKFNNYYEPFVGSGAVLFGLLPENAIINDNNSALINAYKQIRDSLNETLKIIDKYDKEIVYGKNDYYVNLREEYNNKMSNNEYDIELAAMFIFLNKHCFNGLYRINSKGLFNASYNKSTCISYNRSSIIEVSNYLQNVKILNEDFEIACKNATKGDFVFLDSPYIPIEEKTFSAYTKEGFTSDDHKRVANLFDELTNRGCYCMTTNHNVNLIQELYGGKGYTIDIVSAKRKINPDASKRKDVEEVIIFNY